MNILKLEQGTPEWLEFRRNGIGSSDIANIMGVKGAFKSRQEVLFEKLGHTKELTDHQKRIFNEGHEWEAVVRNQLNQDAGYNFEPVVAVYGFNPRLFASLDGYDAEKKMILEVKSVMTKERFKDYCENIPDHYYAQVQWELFVTRMDKALLAFVHDGEVSVKVVDADEGYMRDLVDAANAFLNELEDIKTGTSPAPVQSLDSPEMERIAYLKAQEKEMQIQMDMVSEEIKQLSEKILIVHNAFKVVSDKVTLEWVEREGSVDYKKIPELQNIDLNQYRKKGTKYLRVTLAKK
jgi:putative phage-type endonuclease